MDFRRHQMIGDVLNGLFYGCWINCYLIVLYAAIVKRDGFFQSVAFITTWTIGYVFFIKRRRDKEAV